MRPQQNRRMRGRGNNNNNNNSNNNRKGPNPLTRSYESNGPDVKIRGTAQQIADKYTTLARDAQSSGDRVIAENYLQHAEHYNRIIATALAQQAASQQQQRESRDDDEEFGDDNESGFDNNQNQRDQQSRGDNQPRGERQNRDQRENGNGQRDNRRDDRDRDAGTDTYVVQGSGPQPVIDGVPAEVALGEAETPSEGRRARAPRRQRAAQPEENAAATPAELARKVQDDEGGEEAAQKPRRTRRPRLKPAEDQENPTAEEKSDDVGEAAA